MARVRRACLWEMLVKPMHHRTMDAGERRTKNVGEGGVSNKYHMGWASAKRSEDRRACGSRMSGTTRGLRRRSPRASSYTISLVMDGSHYAISWVERN